MNSIPASYDYYKYIKTPKQMRMNSQGGSIANNIGGLISYMDVLVSGKGNGSTINGPLGDKYFVKTQAKCKDVKTNNSVNRSIYINNIPDGTIPFISSAMGGSTFSSFEGIIPGIMGNIANLNVTNIFNSFKTGGAPKCMQITMDTRDVNNITSKQSAYVTLNDIRNMHPCWFTHNNKINPISKKPCRVAFQNIENNENIGNNENNGNNENKYNNLIYLSIILLLFLTISLKK
jgi:hypothetical protein